MNEFKKVHTFNGYLVIIGFGSIGQGVLPLLLRHIDMQPEQIVIIAADNEGIDIAREYHVQHRMTSLTPTNYLSILTPYLAKGSFLLNLSVNVSSVALIELCQKNDVLYLDTCTEPWEGGYFDETLSMSERSNYALREEALKLRQPHNQSPTAILTHGANPGLVSHFLKQALLNIAADTGKTVSVPTTREEWGKLAQSLGIRSIHIAERDTQIANRRKRHDEFLNTWSSEGFISEACQPAELGWGTHERHIPEDGRRHNFGCQASIYLTSSGVMNRVHTWLPLTGETLAFLITHSEAISIADYFTIGQGENPEYRPTVHYAYHPCDDAVLSIHELIGRNNRPQTFKHVLKDEIISGRDELGVLLMGHEKNSYWYGSQLTIEQARQLCPYNGATTLQVTAPVLSAVIWAMKNPNSGIVEADDMPFDEILKYSLPYLGDVVGVYSDWTPLKNRSKLFTEDLDQTDPWQFKNFRVR